MKKFILGICIIATTLSLQAQSEKYYDAMGGTLKKFGEAKTAEELQGVAATFERIGDAEKNQWLPYYYAAMIKTNIALNRMTNEVDKITDEAASILAKAEALEHNASEVMCIKSMIATAKMLVDPQTRWAKYGAESAQWIEKAKQADPANPRPYMLQASSLINTPEQFGGGCKAAKPIATKALELYNTTQNKNPLAPNWGKSQVEKIAACN